MPEGGKNDTLPMHLPWTIASYNFRNTGEKIATSTVSKTGESRVWFCCSQSTGTLQRITVYRWP